MRPMGFYVKASAFTPLSIANCSLWLRADLGVTGSPVTQWADQSGAGNTVATNGASPTFTASNASFNNQPTIDFNGTTQGLSRGGVNGWVGSTAYTFLVAYRLTGGSVVFRSIFQVGQSAANPRYQYLFWDNSNRVNAQAGNGIALWTVGVPFSTVQTMTWDGTNGGASIKLYADAGLVASANASGTPVTNPAMIGIGAAADVAGRLMAGSIAEIVGYTRVLTAPELALVQGYMSTRYGI